MQRTRSVQQGSPTPLILLRNDASCSSVAAFVSAEYAHFTPPNVVVICGVEAQRCSGPGACSREALHAGYYCAAVRAGWVQAGWVQTGWVRAGWVRAGDAAKRGIGDEFALLRPGEDGECDRLAGKRERERGPDLWRRWLVVRGRELRDTLARAGRVLTGADASAIVLDGAKARDGMPSAVLMQRSVRISWIAGRSATVHGAVAGIRNAEEVTWEGHAGEPHARAHHGGIVAFVDVLSAGFAKDHVSRWRVGRSATPGGRVPRYALCKGRR
ncbi:hypothetical protein K438DRAFT_1779982 [Mycena galopus ATCC 62051]|nr:hypothetical protein K438DRAFT_1779982 [Mycena galopus ATCC 62051]